jgi:hypothetical protein
MEWRELCIAWTAKHTWRDINPNSQWHVGLNAKTEKVTEGQKLYSGGTLMVHTNEKDRAWHVTIELNEIIWWPENEQFDPVHLATVQNCAEYMW